MIIPITVEQKNKDMGKKTKNEKYKTQFKELVSMCVTTNESTLHYLVIILRLQ